MLYTIKDLAIKFNCTERLIYSAILRSNIIVTKKDDHGRNLIDENNLINYLNLHGRPEILEDEINLWHDSYINGMSCKDIGKRFKRSPEIVSKRLKMVHNINPRDYFERYSESEKDFYYEAYQAYIGEKNGSIKKIVEDYKIEHPTRFVNYIKRLGFKVKSFSEARQLCHNENFFENIDSEIKAYLLGFFAADGHIEKRTDYCSYSLRVGVQLNDSHILKLYLKHISKDSVISCKKNLASIAITSKKIGEDLLKLGYDNNKTYTTKNIPDLPIDLMYHFIRGYFDGDGSCVLQVRRVGNRLSGYNREFNITAYNKSILEKIALVLNIKSFDINLIEAKSLMVKEHVANFKDSYSLTVNNKDDLKDINEK